MPDGTGRQVQAATVVGARELHDGVRGEDGGAVAGRRGRGRPGMLDAERLVRVPRLVDERPASAPRPAGVRGGRQERGQARPRRRRQIGIPVVRVRLAEGEPKVVTGGTGAGAGAGE